MRSLYVACAAGLLASCGGHQTKSNHSVPISSTSISSASLSSASSSASTPTLTLLTLPSGVQEISAGAGGKSLKIYALADDIIYISYAGNSKSTDYEHAFSEMIANKNFQGAQKITQSAQAFTTTKITFSIDNNLCVSVEDSAQHKLNKTCPQTISDTQFTLSLSAPNTTQAYGLGEQFFDAGSNGDWLGRKRTPGVGTGNRMINFAGGQVGNLQIPLLLTSQPEKALGYFLDSPHAQTWDLANKDSWTINGYTNRFGLFIFAKENLQQLRTQYMELTGTPPVPPRAAFGLWISEYGFDNWAEAENKIHAQHSANMPVDGIVFDLQWFGGIATHKMGTLQWDANAFPDAAGRLKNWKNNWGVDAVTIEESYIDAQTPDYTDLRNRNYLVRKCAGCDNSYFNEWWGTGGMLDWSNKEGAAYWHTSKRTPLINAGVLGHWTDLGEPENFDPNGWYADTYNNERHDHASIHNLYNFYWSQSIFDGYKREQPQIRPWILSRSGTAGSQRFGVNLWSGDIGSDSTSLAAHQQVQMHMSMSGVDYFGTDVGGFHRGNISAQDFKNLYTTWFANSALFDIPLRVHTENLCNCKETAPALAGDFASNKFNLQLRYQLIPYLYSLAHDAYKTGNPVYPPLAFYHPQDTNVRGLGEVKYIGPWLIARAFAKPGDATNLSTYVPAGNWLDWHNQKWIKSSGQKFDLSANLAGKTVLPLLAKEGAIIPMAYVDDKTWNTKGQRSDGTSRDELLLRVVASNQPSEFTLYEDDGRSTDYLRGGVAQTLIKQEQKANGIEVIINATQGSYPGMLSNRSYQLELFAKEDNIDNVYLNGQAIPVVNNIVAFTQAPQSTAYKADRGHWFVKTMELDSHLNKEITFSAK